MAYLAAGHRPSSPGVSSNTSSFGLANINLPEPKLQHPQEWRLPKEHKMEKREQYSSWQLDVKSQIDHIEEKLNKSLKMFPDENNKLQHQHQRGYHQY